NAVLVSADGLRPQAERAFSGTAAAGVQTHIRMEQVTDEVLFDLQIALIDIGDPRKGSHVSDHFALGVVFALPFAIPIRQPRNGVQRSPFSYFLTRKIKLLAADPIDRLRCLERLGRQYGGVSPNETDPGLRPVLLDRLRHLAVVFQRWGGGVN